MVSWYHCILRLLVRMVLVHWYCRIEMPWQQTLHLKIAAKVWKIL